jgi:tRNA (mo5U34)-methyltransferase
MKTVLTIEELQEQIKPFRKQLQEIKNSNANEGFTWFGYDALGNVEVLNSLLTGKNRELINNIVGQHVADIGAADGDLSFFLESMGINAHIIDFGPTNWNGLQGAHTLKKLLNSNVDIYDVDLDSQFLLPFENYELIFFLGILYHLKNPFYALERLSKATRYLILSTRIANLSRQNGIDYTTEPMAYLLAPDELNNDATNYWIFSDAGLRRLVQRTGWEIRDFVSLGVHDLATPQDLNRDQRAFMLLESRR